MRGAPSSAHGFRHEAMLYEGSADLVRRLAPFLRDGVRAGEPTLVVVDAEKIAMLRSELGAEAGKVHFADMAEVGLNPARIIPAWQSFVDRHAGTGRRLRGVGEPIWASRRSDELVECERHEALLNLAFAQGPPWWLVCPYDITTLDRSALDEAERNHPFMHDGGSSRDSTSFRGLAEVAEPFDLPLPDPEVVPDQMAFEAGQIAPLRRFARRHAKDAGLGRARVYDLVLAVDEIATNSVVHGGGRGLLRVWQSGSAIVCEISDDGRIEDPLAGRTRPRLDQRGGFGLWAANQLCDLVQVRTFPAGSVVRLHMSLG